MHFRIKLLPIAGLLAAPLLAQSPPPGGPGFGPGFPPGGPQGPAVTGAPYSGIQTTQIQQTLPDGNQIQKTEQTKVYRDSEGRVRSETTITVAGSTQTVISIFDPVAGYVVRLNLQNLTAVKHVLPASGSAPGGAPPAPPTGANAPQIQKQDLGSKTINGLVATGTQITDTIPAGAIGNAEAIQSVREIWISTALSVPVLVTTNDPRFGTSTMELTNVSQGEPDASLFQIPSNYTVTTESRKH